MNLNRLKKIVMILVIGILAFFTSNNSVEAKQSFPDYAIIPSGYSYCDYEIYTTNDDSAKSTYNGHHIYFAYDGSSIKWINPSTGEFMSSGSRWDTDGVLKQSVKYDAGSLASAMVENGKIAHCPTIYFKEIDSKYNLQVSTDATSVSHGGIEGELHLVDGTVSDITELESCSYSARTCTKKGDFVGDTIDDVIVHRYSNGDVTYSFNNPEVSANTTLNTSGINKSVFANGCPKDVYVDCGGVASEGTAYCNILPESKCLYEKGESNGESGHNQGDDKKINTKDRSNNKTNSNNDGTESCEDILGPNVMSDIKTVMGWLRIAAPILVIVLGALDFSKAVLVDDPKALSKASSTFAKRLIAAVALFFAPYILMYLLDAANSIISQSSCDIRGF